MINRMDYDILQDVNCQLQKAFIINSNVSPNCKQQAFGGNAQALKGRNVASGRCNPALAT